MGKNVNIDEVVHFSEDLKKASDDIRSQLDQVTQEIEAINSMDTFSGKAATEAKDYFSGLHQTILESFRGLFDDLEENLQSHLKEFSSKVDSSDEAVIRSQYIQDIQEDIDDDFSDLTKQDEIIRETIQSVSDISSASPPSFTGTELLYKDASKHVRELEEDFISYTGVDDKANAKQVLQQIEAGMSKAKASDGKARFADFEGAKDNSHIAKLQNYNEVKREEQLEKAEDIRDSALKDHTKQSSKDVVNKAFQEFKNGDITYEKYMTILDYVKNTSEDMSENTIKENVTDSFIEYLEDRGMFQSYLQEHETVSKIEKLRNAEKQIEKLDPELREIAEKAQEDHEKGDLDADSYESLLTGLVHGGKKFASSLVENKFSDDISKITASKLVNWWKGNTTYFVDKGLTFSFAGGGDLAMRETPSKVANALRTGAKYSPKFIGSALDFGAQVLTGEDVGEAAIKTGGHLGGAALGTGAVTLAAATLPVSLPGMAITGAAFAASTLGSMAFDWVYDHGLKEGLNKVGDAVSGFFGKLGSAFD